MTTPALPVPEKFDERRHSAFFCPDRTGHVWTYLGSQRYRCNRCLMEIMKADLKRLTD